MVLTIAAEKDWDVLELGVQTLFLNTDVDEEVYVKMAPGFETTTEEGIPLVMMLLKSLYGLRESPRNWFGTIDGHLKETGFTPLKSNPCVCIYSFGGKLVILTLYLDDFLLLGGTIGVLNTLKGKLTGRFAMTDM